MSDLCGACSCALALDPLPDCHLRSSTSLVQRGVASSPRPTSCPRSTAGLRLLYRVVKSGGDRGLTDADAVEPYRAFLPAEIGEVADANEERFAAAETENGRPPEVLLGHRER